MNEEIHYSLFNYKQPEFKSILIIGEQHIYITQHFNWFNKLMIRLVFGLKIVDNK